MNNKLTVVLLLLTLLLGTGIYFVLRTPQDYSEKISYDVASTLITHFSNDQYDEAFENLDIVHIDDELYLISYSQTPVNDVYTSKHSWIVYKDQNVYEVKDGQLLKGEHLDVEIAKKFNHNIQTFQKSVIIETIDFEQEIRKSNRIIKDKKSVFQKGINGELEKTQSTTLINGEVVDSAT
ncbi:MAG: hypothetical protein GX760_03120, partial [Erysipelothrix sp.]|nr:hypothetical protein [Erysipelothrix sp.]